MRAGMVGGALVGLVALSGCAGIRSAQEVERLRADLGLLDQRISQIERASLREPSPWPAQTQAAEPLASASTPAESPPALAAVAKPTKTEIQKALKHAGFYQGPVDGKIGPVTREAIRSFQEIHGLKVDGVVGKQTWEKLAPYLEVSSLPSDLSPAESLK